MQKKNGISLIVLVITIIVMIILAAVIILTLNNNGIISWASKAVEETDLTNVKEMASMGWTEAYLKDTEETKDDAYYQKEVIAELKKQGLTDEQLSKYKITATTKGVEVELINTSENGLYYDEAYVADIIRDEEPTTVAYVFHENGSAEVYEPTINGDVANGLYVVQSVLENGYTYENDILTFQGQVYTVSKDGKTIEKNGQEYTLQLGLEHGPYRGYTYQTEAHSNGEVYSVMLNADGTGTGAVKQGENVLATQTAQIAFAEDEHKMTTSGDMMTGTFIVSLDGKKLYWKENETLFTIVGNPESQEKDEQDGGEIVHSGIIPEGGKYYVGVTSEKPGEYTGENVVTYTAGQAFPATVNTGDVYVYGDYEYRYNMAFLLGWGIYDANYETGWGVLVTDTTKTTYAKVIHEINDKEVKIASGIFGACEKMVTSPELPDSIIEMSFAFSGCTQLKTVTNIPNKTENMIQTFNGCSALESVPTLPDDLTDMAGTFLECTSLKVAPVIPSNVNNMYQTFQGCTSLTGNITINANPTGYESCFADTVKPITIIGSCSSTTKANLAETAKSENVTY